MVTPTAMSFVQDRREQNAELLIVTVPRGTSAPDATNLRDALANIWPAREVRIFEAPNLQQVRLA